MIFEFKKFFEDIDSPTMARERERSRFAQSMAKDKIEYLADLWEDLLYAQDEKERASDTRARRRAESKIRELKRILQDYAQEDVETAKQIAIERVKSL